ncbi:MAG: ABC transporter ATP-binding protein [Muricomes sp.]
MEIMKAVSLNKVYTTGNIEVKAIDNVNLSIDEGEFIAISGASGSGKSTLLNMLGGLDYPSSGLVSVKGKVLSSMNGEDLTIFRRSNIGFVFQNYNLVPILNVYENIALPVKLDGEVIDEEFIEQLAVELSIEEKLYQMPAELSGGQQQRAAIARALVTRPAIILADEPTGNLDSKTSEKVIHLMKAMAKKYHQTMAIITHDEKIADMSDRVIQIEDGRIV